jgi:hypothetical protein
MSETYSISRDGIADLGLPHELDEKLDAWLTDATWEQRAEIEDRVNVQLAKHGGWDAAWDEEPVAIVRDVLGL